MENVHADKKRMKELTIKGKRRLNRDLLESGKLEDVRREREERQNDWKFYLG